MKRPMYAILNEIDSLLNTSRENVIIVGTANEGEDSYPHLVLNKIASNKAEKALVEAWLNKSYGAPLMVQMYEDGEGRFLPCKRICITLFY